MGRKRHSAEEIINKLRQAAVVAVRCDPSITTEEQRVAAFVSMTGASHATYLRAKAALGRST